MALVRPQWHPNQSGTSQYPMGLQNGKVVGAWQQNVYGQRMPQTSDYDFTQRMFRRYVDASGAQSVQFPNGFEHSKWQGRRIPYRGTGWYWAAMPIVPGQTRGMYGGFYPREPSTSQLEKVVQATAGSQPLTPAGTNGPGGIVGDTLDNPMTG